MVNVLSVFGYKQIEIFGLRITYYAICIVLGAICAYKLSQYFLKKKGYDPGAIENLFYVAFPSGIIGARIWWVLAELNGEFAGRPWYEIFAIWNGGLAIQGGALAGIIVGVIFMIKRRPNIPVLLATDCIVPTILVAQAIGRWGNFFNQEVYGNCVSTWTWLPDFIENRLVIQISNSGYVQSAAGSYVYLCGSADQMVVPLFLIEGICNVAGFFLIAYGIPALFRWISRITQNKVSLAQGDLMCSYLIWYGVVRAILEPLRNPQFTMGSTDGKTHLNSLYMSIAFIVIGIVGIVLCHLYRNRWRKPVLDSNTISGSEAEKEAVTVSEAAQEEADESEGD